MDRPAESSEPNPTPSAAPRSRWRRIARVAGIVLALYLLTAYVIIPRAWERYARRHPAFDNSPRITKTGDGHPGDPLNVALIGAEANVKRAMKAADWFEADPLGLKSDVRIGVDSVLKREYDEAPVSKLFLFGRKEDLAFEQPVGDDPRHRHHVRFWKTDKVDDQGLPIWVGSAAYDERVGLSHTTGQITHHIDGNVDAERDYVVDSLQKAQQLSNVYKIPGFHKQLEGRNGGGDLWHTDGALWVGVIAGDK